MDENVKLSNVKEREITKKNGFAMLFANILGYVATVVTFVLGLVFAINYEDVNDVIFGLGIGLFVVSLALLIVSIVLSCGLKSVNPNEAMVFTLFGEYYGTIKSAGFYFINPFCSVVVPNEETTGNIFEISSDANGNSSAKVAGVTKKKISTKVITLNNEKQKVNDALGNPIIIGAVVICKIIDPTKAVLNVDNYMKFLSTQCDSVIRNISRLYPYDIISDENEDDNEKTLRGSSQEIADSMEVELQKKVEDAGIEIMEVRITHLSYAEEIAVAMLQRQQATAIIAARQKIVEGAVSMVKMAIDQLGEEEIVVLDEERKAAMVSNLLVVLCGNKEAQPIVNSGSIY